MTKVKCLTEKQQAEVVKRHYNGETMAEIAARFYVSETTILNVLKNNGYEQQRKKFYTLSEYEQHAYMFGYKAGYNASRTPGRGGNRADPAEKGLTKEEKTAYRIGYNTGWNARRRREATKGT